MFVPPPAPVFVPPPAPAPIVAPPPPPPPPPPTKSWTSWFAPAAAVAETIEEADVEIIPETAERPVSDADKKQSWMARLKSGLSKTSSSLSLLFVGAKIDEDLYDELEAALLMADAGMPGHRVLAQ